MSERAIYSVIEKEKTEQLYSQWGADLSMPFAALHTAENLRSELLRLKSVSEMLPLINYNHYFDYSAIGDGKIFERLDAEQAEEMLEDFGRTPAIQMHVTLDLDNGMARFEHNSLCYHSPQPPDFSVCISDGMRCLEETFNEAEHEGKQLSGIIESRMESKLEQAVREAGQQIKPQAPDMGL